MTSDEKQAESEAGKAEQDPSLRSEFVTFLICRSFSGAKVFCFQSRLMREFKKVTNSQDDSARAARRSNLLGSRPGWPCHVPPRDTLPLNRLSTLSGGKMNQFADFANH